LTREKELRNVLLKGLTGGAIGCLLSTGAVVAPAHADGDSTLACPDRDPIYNVSSVTVATRPTNVYSSYITGPGTITYDDTKTATVSVGADGQVGGDINLIVISASQQIGVNLTVSKSWTSGFHYTLEVPAGQTRRMRLFQESRAFLTTKKVFDIAKCKYVTKYANADVNAPRSARVDSWRLEA
jgi:hypothetical protein